MKTSDSPYRCAKHGFYLPDFERKIDGYDCPRILCAKCEKESYAEKLNQRPREIKYFYENREAVVLQEAHNGSAVWRFDPPVIYPEWSFAEDLSPIIPDNALTSEEIMERMEELLPEVEKLCREQSIEMPDSRDLLIMPGRKLCVSEISKRA